MTKKSQNCKFIHKTVILENSWRSEKWRKPANAKRFAFQANAIDVPMAVQIFPHMC